MDRIVKVVKAEVVMWACQPSRTQSLQCIGKRHQQFRISPHPLEIVTGREALKEVLEKWRLSRAWPGEQILETRVAMLLCRDICKDHILSIQSIQHKFDIQPILERLNPLDHLVWSTRTVPLQPGRPVGSDSGEWGGTGCNQPDLTARPLRHLRCP